MLARHTLGQRPPVLLKTFACRLQASWDSENCHQLLPPKWQWWGGASEPHNGPNAGNGGQQAPKYWDEQLPHVEFVYNISVSAATGLAPNEVHMGRGFRASLSRSSDAPGPPATRAWPATNSPTATWRPTASIARTISFVNTMPSQFLA